MEAAFDFHFPSTVSKIKQTKDNLSLIAYGDYPPQIRCFDLNHLNLKFQRTIDCQIHDFQILSRNWEKLILLRSDRYLEFHVKAGYYHQIKIPKNGYTLVVDEEECSDIIYIPSATDEEVFRFNIEKGRFISSIKGKKGQSNTSASKSIQGHCLALGKDRGSIELWDIRTIRKPIGIIHSALHHCHPLSYFYPQEKLKNCYSTSLHFCKTAPYKLYSGFSSGNTIVYDLRTFRPIISKKIDHKLSIKTIDNSSADHLVLSVDEKIIKIWHEISGETKLTIRPHYLINDVCRIDNTGFLFIATMHTRIDSRYIPLLGPIPNWCFFPEKHGIPTFFKKKTIQRKIEKKKKNYYEKLDAVLENIKTT